MATDTPLREKVARAKYEEKRARLLEAFGDTCGWPEWERLKPTLKEIEMEEHDAAIALIRRETLEEAAMVVETHSRTRGNSLRNYAGVIAAAIRALKEKNNG